MTLYKIKKYKWQFLITLLVLGTVSFLLSLVISIQNTISPNGIVIHHSAIPFQVNKPEDVEIISLIHKKKGFSVFYWGKFYTIGYHYIILPDGTIVNGRPEIVRGAHAVGFNDYIGICLIGDFSESDNPKGIKGLNNPTSKQLESLKILTKELMTKYNISSDSVLTHKMVEAKTECPGEKFLYEDFIKQINLNEKKSRF